MASKPKNVAKIKENSAENQPLRIQTSDQVKAVELIIKFASQCSKPFFHLFGYAGTGKTFILTNAVQLVLEKNLMDQVFICAPTHKALNVLTSYFKSNLPKTFFDEFQKKIMFTTIHKLLEFRPIISNENGSKSFKTNSESRFLKKLERKLIIVDESSMVSCDMATSLKKHVEMYQLMCIYSGDIMQLPPVKEDLSVIFKSVDSDWNVTLNEIMRTNNVDIKNVSKLIREWDGSDQLIEMLVELRRKTKTDKLKILRRGDVPKELDGRQSTVASDKSYLKSTWFKKTVEKISEGTIPVILTWYNATANTYSKALRQLLHKKSVENEYAIGDYVIFDNFHASPLGVKFYTSDMIKITSTKISIMTLCPWGELLIAEPQNLQDKSFNTTLKKLISMDCKFTVYELSACRIFSDFENKNVNVDDVIRVLDGKCTEAYKTFVANVETHITDFFTTTKSEKLTAILWKAFHTEICDIFADVSYGYSITVYKSQGSTFKTVIVDMVDLFENKTPKEIQKALYTAITRASEELWLLVE
jgi:hypothetical protein